MLRAKSRKFYCDTDITRKPTESGEGGKGGGGGEIPREASPTDTEKIVVHKGL